MSDPTKDPTQTQNQPSSTNPSPSGDDKQIQLTVNVNSQGEPDLLATDVGKALAEKIRAEEKDKLHKRMEKAKDEARVLADEKNQLMARQVELENELKQARQEQESRSKDLETQLADIRAKQADMDKREEEILKEAAKMVAQSELSALKKERLLAAKVDPDLVDLDGAHSAEEIDAAIAAAREKQQTIEERIRAQVREEMGQNIPEPLAPDGVSGLTGIEQKFFDPAQRRSLGDLSPEDYRVLRDAALAKATS